MELADLNLLTYVIKFKGGRYFTDRAGAIQDWSQPYSTDILVEANIYNDPAHARRICKILPKSVTVHPVPKNVFFYAILKGERS